MPDELSPWALKRDRVVRAAKIWKSRFDGPMTSSDLRLFKAVEALEESERPSVKKPVVRDSHRT